MSQKFTATLVSESIGEGTGEPAAGGGSSAGQADYSSGTDGGGARLAVRTRAAADTAGTESGTGPVDAGSVSPSAQSAVSLSSALSRGTFSRAPTAPAAGPPAAASVAAAAQKPAAGANTGRAGEPSTAATNGDGSNVHGATAASRGPQSAAAAAEHEAHAASVGGTAPASRTVAFAPQTRREGGAAVAGASSEARSYPASALSFDEAVELRNKYNDVRPTFCLRRRQSRASPSLRCASRKLDSLTSPVTPAGDALNALAEAAACHEGCRYCC